MNSEDDDFSAFCLPGNDGSPANIAQRLMHYPEHRHLRENDIKLAYLMRLEPKEKGGKRELGSVHDVKYMAQGAFKDLFAQLLVQWVGFMPDFVVVLDKSFWAGANGTEMEALLFHELKHIQQKVDKYGSPKFDMNGNPSYGIAEHDVSAFIHEVKRYGAWSNDLRAFLAPGVLDGLDDPS